MSATVSEALAVLKTADREELEQEIQIIEEEIDDFKKQIDSRRRTIKQVKMLAGINVLNRSSKNGNTNGNSKTEGNGEKLWESIRSYIMHSVPTSTDTLCRELSKTFQQIHTSCIRREGKTFTRLADKRWALIVPKDED